MQKFGLLLLFFIPIISCSQKPESTTYTQQIRKHRYELNVKFADKETTPLTEKDFKEFSTLKFFPIDSTYHITAKFELNENPILFEMPTTTDRKPIYKTYGVASFELKGETYELQIYQNQELILDPEYKNHLFIPFVDKTNGNESYGGGRYLDLEQPEDDTIILDFNRAYNPYCAYSDRYSCPIPPIENHLNVAINAGVKAYKH